MIPWTILVLIVETIQLGHIAQSVPVAIIIEISVLMSACPVPVRVESIQDNGLLRVVREEIVGVASNARTVGKDSRGRDVKSVKMVIMVIHCIKTAHVVSAIVPITRLVVIIPVTPLLHSVSVMMGLLGESVNSVSLDIMAML